MRAGEVRRHPMFWGFAVLDLHRLTLATDKAVEAAQRN